MPQSEHVWFEADGIKVNVRVSHKHIVDEATAHNTYFTPFATDDPGGRTTSEKGGRYVISDPHLSTDAQLLAWKERHIALLNRLLDGYVRGDGDDDLVYVARKYSNKLGVAVIRVFDLSWHTSSDKDGWDDFPEILCGRFGLDRRTAWRLAWALVRAARLEMGHVYNALIEHCEVYVVTTKSKKAACQQALESALNKAITTLKEHALP